VAPLSGKPIGTAPIGITSSIGHTSGHSFFVWVLIKIGVTGLFSVILSVHGPWGLRKGQSHTA
jgi:hypothetical protein